jgi:hypothetical protein
VGIVSGVVGCVGGIASLCLGPAGWITAAAMLGIGAGVTGATMKGGSWYNNRTNNNKLNKIKVDSLEKLREALLEFIAFMNNSNENELMIFKAFYSNIERL